MKWLLTLRILANLGVFLDFFELLLVLVGFEALRAAETLLLEVLFALTSLPREPSTARSSFTRLRDCFSSYFVRIGLCLVD